MPAFAYALHVALLVVVAAPWAHDPTGSRRAVAAKTTFQVVKDNSFLTIHHYTGPGLHD